jgi:hypothetical protein
MINHPVKFSIEDFTEEDKARFWSKVDIKGENDCWLWTGGTYNTGYGLFYLNKKLKTLKAHRISCVLNNKIIPDGYFVCHSCNVPGCVNPSHLDPGTAYENNIYRKISGRSATGDRSASRKYPGLRLRGKDHPFVKDPSLCARGDKNGARLHPEKLKRGQDNAAAKLTPGKVLSIRSEYATGLFYLKHLAEKYGVCFGTIARIVNRQIWKHI